MDTTMTLNPLGPALELSRGALWDYPLRRGGLRLSCREGAVWITVDGDLEDHVLKPGEELRVNAPGRVVIEALRPTRLEIESVPGAEPARVREGLVLGALGVLAFSLTLPATRVAVPELGGTWVGLGRAVVAAVLAAGVLAVRRESFPERRHWAGLVRVVLGVVVGFPLFSALAMHHMPAAQGAVLVGLLPAATAVAAVLRARERPSMRFWVATVAGLGGVLAFAVAQGAGAPTPGSALMLLAVVGGAMGYAEGGVLSREMGGWRVICWALVLSAPLLLPVLLFVGVPEWQAVSARAWLGLGYLSVVSMFLGFFAWYQGMALGGVARVSQLQLAQPLLTLGWCALWLGEPVGAGTLGTALFVLLCVFMSVRSRVRGGAAVPR